MANRACHDSAPPKRPGWVIFTSGAKLDGSHFFFSGRRSPSSNSAIANAPAGEETLDPIELGKISGAAPRDSARFHSHTICAAVSGSKLNTDGNWVMIAAARSEALAISARSRSRDRRPAAAVPVQSDTLSASITGNDTVKIRSVARTVEEKYSCLPSHS